MSNPRPEVFAELACALPGRQAFESQALSVLNDELGIEVGFFVWPSGPSPVAVGFDPGVRAASASRWHQIGQELAPLTPVARAQGGVAVDRAVLGWERLKRMEAYQRIMRPHGGTCTALVYLQARGVDLGRLVLGRSGRTTFTEPELDYVRRRVPVLSLCIQGYAPEPDPLLAPALTRREAEVLGYLPLGYTNAQIALALGSSPKTVRNQLSSLYEKLGVASRAEAAACAARHGLDAP